MPRTRHSSRLPPPGRLLVCCTCLQLLGLAPRLSTTGTGERPETSSSVRQSGPGRLARGVVESVSIATRSQ